jgi:hypothetical protein
MSLNTNSQFRCGFFKCKNDCLGEVHVKRVRNLKAIKETNLLPLPIEVNLRVIKSVSDKNVMFIAYFMGRLNSL